jgi:hypothetical protein
MPKELRSPNPRMNARFRSPNYEVPSRESLAGKTRIAGYPRSKREEAVGVVFAWARVEERFLRSGRGETRLAYCGSTFRARLFYRDARRLIAMRAARVFLTTTTTSIGPGCRQQSAAVAGEDGVEPIFNHLWAIGFIVFQVLRLFIDGRL